MLGDATIKKRRGVRTGVRLVYYVVLSISIVMASSVCWMPIFCNRYIRKDVDTWMPLMFGLFVCGSVLMGVCALWYMSRRIANIRSVSSLLGLREVCDYASLVCAAQRLVRTAFLPVIPSTHKGDFINPFKFFAVGEVSGIDVALIESVGRRLGVATTVGARFPLLSVRREDVLDKVARIMGLEDVDTEWASFNATFRVKTEDRKFALTFLDSAVMRWLYEMREHIEGFDVRGPVLLLHWKSSCFSFLTVEGARERIEMLAALSGIVPRIVMEQYSAPKVSVDRYLFGLGEA